MRQKVMYVLHDRATDAGKRLHWSSDAGVLSARPYICKVILEAALSSVRTVVGYIVAVCMGMVDFSALSGTSVIALPHIMPFKPEFN